MSGVQSTARKCEVCGKSFRFFHCYLKKAKRAGRFCSVPCRTAGLPIPLEVRFWRCVGPPTETGCTLWTGTRNKAGYGNIGKGDRNVLAHRVAYEIAHGPIPARILVLHNCPGGDNPACVNPAHLWLGTHADNAVDAFAKGQSPRGEERTQSKLTEAAVLAIRARYAAGGITAAQLAHEYGVCRALVQAVLLRQRWSHV